jgi:NADP-dependent 3-hydroxy acid dehydrogenase YdfG
MVTGYGLRELARGLDAGRVVQLVVATGGTAGIGWAAVRRFQRR